jgi:hypothetical protein
MVSRPKACMGPLQLQLVMCICSVRCKGAHLRFVSRDTGFSFARDSSFCVGAHAGGLLFELLTGGTHPYAWFRDYEFFLIKRRLSTGPVVVPGIRTPQLGLADKNVLEAAEIDEEDIPYSSVPDMLGVSTTEIEGEIQRVMVTCLSFRPEARPRLKTMEAIFRYAQFCE